MIFLFKKQKGFISVLNNFCKNSFKQSTFKSKSNLFKNSNIYVKEFKFFLASVYSKREISNVIFRFTNKENTDYFTFRYALFAAIGGIFGIFSLDKLPFKECHLKENSEKNLDPPERKDLQIFTRNEVKQHGKNARRIWVTYKQVNKKFLIF
jgi:hypothetical protein